MNERLGPYELLAELGSGGMASVWLARTRGPGDFEKRVAVKRIHPHLAHDPGFVAMFLDEARIAACVDHPNVCSTIDFGEASSTHYLAMELVRGRTLAQVADALPDGHHGMTARERCAFVARIAIDAAEGLHAAHETCSPEGEPLSIVHRDVAPANLLVRWDGVTQVMDFGCARARAVARMYRSADGEARGHPSYVAPELLRGADPDRRVDVWALGVVLWELLTGERLFHRTAIHDTLFAIADGTIPAPSEKDPDIPPELDHVLARALAKDPERRYQTARQLAEDLREWLRGTGMAMDAPQMADRMARLFPGEDEVDRADRAAAIHGPFTSSRSTRPTAVTAELVDPGLGALVSRLRHPLVLAAMVVGLLGGLGLTAAVSTLTQEAAPVEAVHAATMATGSPQAPRMIRVPEAPEPMAASDSFESVEPTEAHLHLEGSASGPTGEGEAGDSLGEGVHRVVLRNANGEP